MKLALSALISLFLTGSPSHAQNGHEGVRAQFRNLALEAAERFEEIGTSDCSLDSSNFVIKSENFQMNGPHATGLYVIKPANSSESMWEYTISIEDGAVISIKALCHSCG